MVAQRCISVICLHQQKGVCDYTASSSCLQPLRPYRYKRSKAGLLRDDSSSQNPLKVAEFNFTLRLVAPGSKAILQRSLGK